MKPPPINVTPVPVNALLSVPDPACAGEPVTLAVSGSDVLDATWWTPNGTVTGTELNIPAASLIHTGTYTVVPFSGPCAGDTLTSWLEVLSPAVPDLGNDTTFCAGALFLVELPPGFTQPVWNDQSTGNSIFASASGTYSVSATDVQGCPTYGEITLEAIE